jgi:hypothetical protein
MGQHQLLLRHAQSAEAGCQRDGAPRLRWRRLSRLCQLPPQVGQTGRQPAGPGRQRIVQVLKGFARHPARRVIEIEPQLGLLHLPHFGAQRRGQLLHRLAPAFNCLGGGPHRGGTVDGGHTPGAAAADAAHCQPAVLEGGVRAQHDGVVRHSTTSYHVGGKPLSE